jgi:M-phase inducer tyrosine phosphatase
MGGFGPNSFNFKDLSMKKSQPDYFTVKPMPGSSPAGSLAADLSQNFHIDQRSVIR